MQKNHILLEQQTQSSRIQSYATCLFSTCFAMLFNAEKVGRTYETRHCFLACANGHVFPHCIFLNICSMN